MLPGIKELTGIELPRNLLVDAILDAFQKITGMDVMQATWSRTEEQTMDRLAAEKYSQSVWNKKR